MRKILLITVAGMSSRFSESIGRPCLKCLYYKKDITESLLYRMIYENTEFDKYIIVGGFMFPELELLIRQNFAGLTDKIILVQNSRYKEYGSGYSLYLGLKAALDLGFDELIFAEGDLYVDSGSFRQICDIHSNVITYNTEMITADKSVVGYFDQRYGIHYIYDTAHKALEIDRPFLGIFNSGQIWKFIYRERLDEVLRTMSETDWKGTNLVIIQRYFGNLKREEYEMIGFKKWINCNTVMDFERINQVGESR